MRDPHDYLCAAIAFATVVLFALALGFDSATALAAGGITAVLGYIVSE